MSRPTARDANTLGNGKGVPGSTRHGVYPQVFDGQLMFVMVGMLGQYDVLRMIDVDRALGRRPSGRTSEAAIALETLGVIRRTVRSKQNIAIELDERHPAYPQIALLGRRIHEVYLRDTPPPQRLDERYGAFRDDEPEYEEPRDFHVLGTEPSKRMLHLIAASGGMAPSELAWALGIDRVVVTRSLHALRLPHHIVELRSQSYGRRGITALLDRRFPLHLELMSLLVRLNELMPHYGELAEAIRVRRAVREQGIKRPWRGPVPRDVPEVHETADTTDSA